MSKFTPKVLLKEEEANPLEVNSVDLSYDEQYKQAILGAIASETAAYNEYTQILAIEPHVTTDSLVKLFHDTLTDIANEEMKHLAQLNTQLSKVPESKEAYKDGEEEANSGTDKDNSKEDVKESLIESSVNENVEPERHYSAQIIIDIIANAYDLSPDDESWIAQSLDPERKDVLSGEEVDQGMLQIAQKYQMSYEEIEALENQIMYSKDPVQGEHDENKADAEIIEDILPQIKNQKIRDELQAVIDAYKNNGVIE